MKKKIVILIHILFWAGWIYLIAFFRASASLQVRLVYIGIFGLVNISAFYVNLLILLPRFFKRKRFWLLALSWIVLILLYAALKNYLNFLLTPFVPPNYKMYVGFIATLRQSIYIVGFFIFISTVYKLAEEWFLNERVRDKLEKEKLKAELSFLRSQVNPHFLFNTLNNIYTLAYKRSPKAPDAIAELSAIMRYILYESMDTEVPLDRELDYLKHFIRLQELRVSGGLQIKMNISGEVETHQIAPLLLINFVENTFKHGVLDDAKHPVGMTIEARHKEVFFYISNKVADGDKDQHRGIGLKNVKRRLDLLYPRRYRLKITEKEGHYAIALHLTTNQLP